MGKGAECFVTRVQDFGVHGLRIEDSGFRGFRVAGFMDLLFRMEFSGFQGFLVQRIGFSDW